MNACWYDCDIQTVGLDRSVSQPLWRARYIGPATDSTAWSFSANESWIGVSPDGHRVWVAGRGAHDCASCGTVAFLLRYEA